MKFVWGAKWVRIKVWAWRQQVKHEVTMSMRLEVVVKIKLGVKIKSGGEKQIMHVSDIEIYRLV